MQYSPIRPTQTRWRKMLIRVYINQVITESGRLKLQASGISGIIYLNIGNHWSVTCHVSYPAFPRSGDYCDCIHC